MRVTERFKDAFWADESKPLVIGGAGGIGSYLTLLLARTGNHSIFLYDMDTIEEVNLGGQLYRSGDIGDNKAIATRNITREFCPLSIIDTNGTYGESSAVTPIMFSAFDNMVARKTMFNNWRSNWNRISVNSLEELDNRWQFLYVDGRINCEY